MRRVHHRGVARTDTEEAGVELVNAIEHGTHPHVCRIRQLRDRDAGCEQLLVA